MSWHKVTLSFKDCFANGPGARLRDAFATILTAHGGRPFDAALFEQNSDENESGIFISHLQRVILRLLSSSSSAAFRVPAAIPWKDSLPRGWRCPLLGLARSEQASGARLAPPL